MNGNTVSAQVQYAEKEESKYAWLIRLLGNHNFHNLYRNQKMKKTVLKKIKNKPQTNHKHSET